MDRVPELGEGLQMGLLPWFLSGTEMQDSSPLRWSDAPQTIEDLEQRFGIATSEVRKEFNLFSTNPGEILEEIALTANNGVLVKLVACLLPDELLHHFISVSFHGKCNFFRLVGGSLEPAKVKGLLTMPSLPKYLEEDMNYRGTRLSGQGTNLDILAECACDLPASINDITPADVTNWIVSKIKCNQPPLKVMFYYWFRLRGTESFLEAVDAVEQCILDYYEEQFPIIFNWADAARASFNSHGGLSRLFNAVFDNPSSFPNPLEMKEWIPSCGILMGGAGLDVAFPLREKKFDKHQQYFKRFDFENLPPEQLAEIVAFASDGYEEVERWSSAEEIAAHPVSFKGFDNIDSIIFQYLNQDQPGSSIFPLLFAGILRDMSLVNLGKIQEILIPRFSDGKVKRELQAKIDQAILFRSLSERVDIPLLHRIFSSQDQRLDGLMMVFPDLIREFSPDNLRAIKQEILLILDRDLRNRLILMVNQALLKEVILVGIEGSILLDASRGRDEGQVAAALPDHGDLLREVGPKSVEIYAERALVGQALRGVLGGDALTEFLASHQDTMRPGELLHPAGYSDAPHREIIRLYGDSPDLLCFLQFATLLIYRGLSPLKVKDEVGRLAEFSRRTSHPALLTSGIELECIGRDMEGNRVINPDLYQWLLNVLPMGGDRYANEVMTSPTGSFGMQSLLLALLVDERFGFLDKSAIFKNRGLISPIYSVHMNIALPKDVPLREAREWEFVMSSSLSRLNRIACGLTHPQFNFGRADIVKRSWHRGSLLDVFGDKDPQVKIEFHGVQLDSKGEHEKRLFYLQLLASAAVHYVRVRQAQTTISPTTGRLAEIYHDMMKKIFTLGDYDWKEAFALEQHFGQAIQAELGIMDPIKDGGILRTLWQNQAR